MGLAELQVVHVTPTVYHKVPTRADVVAPSPPTAGTTNAVHCRNFEDEPGDIPEHSECSLLTVSDYAWSMFVIMPLVVGHWRGTWELMNNLIPKTVSFTSQ